MGSGKLPFKIMLLISYVYIIIVFKATFQRNWLISRILPFSTVTRGQVECPALVTLVPKAKYLESIKNESSLVPKNV